MIGAIPEEIRILGLIKADADRMAQVILASEHENFDLNKYRILPEVIFGKEYVQVYMDCLQKRLLEFHRPRINELADLFQEAGQVKTAEQVLGRMTPNCFIKYPGASEHIKKTAQSEKALEVADETFQEEIKIQRTQRKRNY